MANEYIHLHNISVCMEIAKIPGCNPRYTSGLSRRIAETGKKIEELTVGELLKLDKDYSKYFNSLSA